MEIIDGIHDEQYAKLWDYAQEIRRTNPGTNVKIMCEPGPNDTSRFLRFYICWNALKIGFLEGCRPLIGLDGCHIKGKYKGQILAAIGIDGNNALYPIAYAIVEIENTNTWEWFIKLLIEDLEIKNSHGWIIMTDRQKGLTIVIEKHLPNAEHRYCVRHMYANFKKKFSGLAMKDKFWSCARATTVASFEKEKNELRYMDVDAYDWVKEVPAEHWTRSHFKPHGKCDILLNNLCESFNAAILQARDKPILTMLEKIRVYIMQRMYTKRIQAEKWQHYIGPRIMKNVEMIKNKSASWASIFCLDGKYEVYNINNDRFAVNVMTQTCSCRKWDISGIPCEHACATIANENGDIIEHVSEWYKKHIYMRAYSHFIQPMTSSSEWKQTGYNKIIRPIPKPQPGRKKMKRKKGADEMINSKKPHKLSAKGQIQKCRKCGISGHNKKSCKNNSEAPSNVPNNSQVGKQHNSATTTSQNQQQTSFTQTNKQDVVSTTHKRPQSLVNNINEAAVRGKRQKLLVKRGQVNINQEISPATGIASGIESQIIKE